MFEHTIGYHSILLFWLSSAVNLHACNYCFISDSQALAVPQICFRRGLPPGDGVLFYPGEVFSSSHEPVASTRLERILSSMQVMFFVQNASFFS